MPYSLARIVFLETLTQPFLDRVFIEALRTLVKYLWEAGKRKMKLIVRKGAGNL